MSSMAEHHNLATGQIQFHHRFLDAHLAQVLGGFGDDGRSIVIIELFEVIGGAEDGILGGQAIGAAIGTARPPITAGI